MGKRKESLCLEEKCEIVEGLDSANLQILVPPEIPMALQSRLQRRIEKRNHSSIQTAQLGRLARQNDACALFETKRLECQEWELGLRIEGEEGLDQKLGCTGGLPRSSQPNLPRHYP